MTEPSHYNPEVREPFVPHSHHYTAIRRKIAILPTEEVNPMTPPVTCTLLDLVQAASNLIEDEQEVVAVVVSLVNSGRVRLCGNFAGAKINLPVSLSPFPRHLWPMLLGLHY